MKFACLYAIVRFLPYTETGEFANVGVVLTCPQTGYFDFKLLNRVRRITAFFEELEANVYRSARKSFENELKSVKITVEAQRLTSDIADAAFKRMFAELVRPRESMIRFDQPRVVLTEAPAEKLEQLFGHYVGRNFATKEYQEAAVQRHVMGALRAAHLTDTFRDATIGNEAYHAKFPLVKFARDGGIERVIKPLHLAHDDAANLYDHGWEWLGKIKKLRRDGFLRVPVLLAVNHPAEISGPRAEAYADVTRELEGLADTIVLPYKDDNAVLKFARG